METIFIVNGNTQLVLVPQNEVDRVLLDKLIDSGPVVVTKVTQPVGIIGRSIKDAIVISPNKTTADDTDKA